MYAVFTTGGKQYRAAEGDELHIEKLDQDAGTTLDFDQVLMTGDGDDIKLGAPLLDGGKVSAEILGHGRGDKIRIVKMNRRKHHRKQQGHRQAYTRIRITGISAG